MGVCMMGQRKRLCVCMHAQLCVGGGVRERERAKEGGKERDMGVYTEGQRKTGV